MIRHGPRLVLLAAAVAICLAGPARAEDPPYDPMLLRLAEVLGALHYLGGLCEAGGPDWRSEMAGLLEAEEAGDARRARLVDRFNLGYSSFAAVHRSCTPAARLALERYRDEGATLTVELVARYGPAIPGGAE